MPVNAVGGEGAWGSLMGGIVWQRLRIIIGMRRSRFGTVIAICSSTLTFAACTPVYDWRDVRVADGVLRAQFPCRPATQVRRLTLAGQLVNLSLHACSVGGQTWALAWADVRDPARVGSALAELQSSARANVRATTLVALPLAVPGATPHTASARMSLLGQRSDGQPVREQVAVFVRGTVVVQATVLGETLPDDAVEAFFASLRAGS